MPASDVLLADGCPLQQVAGLAAVALDPQPRQEPSGDLLVGVFEGVDQRLGRVVLQLAFPTGVGLLCPLVVVEDVVVEIRRHRHVQSARESGSAVPAVDPRHLGLQHTPN